jgi:preprotein translocase subunit SecG
MTWILIIGIIIAIILMLVVLVQNPKGGGLASNFSQGNQIFGVEKTTDIVEKITWGAALLIVVVSLTASSYMGSRSKQAKTPTEKPVESIPQPKIPKNN